MKIIGRKQEKAAMQSLVDSGRPEFVAVYGRRRVGKTFFIREFFDSCFTFQFTGYAQATKAEQLAGFNEALNRYGHEAYPLAGDWLTAFSQLIDLLEKSTPDKRTGRKVVFLDEMPWMDTHRSRFLIGLEHFWNGWGSGKADLVLIACGSATTWLTDKVFRNTGGLFNRITRRLHLLPFTLYETEELLNYLGVILNRHQILESYMIFGGIPFYLEMMDKSFSLPQNVDRLCFSENAPLKDEFGILYASLFKHAAHHIDVVEALSSRLSGLLRSEVATATGISDGGTLSKVLEDLEQSNLIRGYQGFGKKRNEIIWQLIDPFTLFYLRFMTSRRGKAGDFWSSLIGSGAHNAWSGYAFEQICLAHVEQIRKALGIKGVMTSISSWRSTKSSPGAQIDLLIERKDQIINLCEMKYSLKEYELDRAQEEALQRKRFAFLEETKTKKGVHLTLITTYGLKRTIHSAHIQSVVTMDDLFQA